MVKIFTAPNIVPIDEFTKLPRFFLSIIGIPTFKVNNVRHFTINFLFYISFINLSLCVLGEMIYLVVSLFKNSGDFIESTFLILCIGFILISIAKALTLVAKMVTLNNLMDQLNEYYPKSAEEQKQYRIAEFVRKTILIMRAYGFVQMFMIWCFNLFPMSSTVSSYLHDHKWSIEFSYLIWYPVDPYRRGFFEVFFLSQFWAAHVSATAICGTDILLCSIVKQICMHLTHLRNSFEKLEPMDQMDEIRKNELIRAYVIKHNLIIK